MGKLEMNKMIGYEQNAHDVQSITSFGFVKIRLRNIAENT
jgi:hypothetical protein